MKCPIDVEKKVAEMRQELHPDALVEDAYPDAKNHHIDAVRYGMQPVWKQRGE